jgi:adenine-specific DNA-methyltransferase
VKVDGERRIARVSALEPRKRIGAWYTPDDLTVALVRWALAGRSGPILDPSFGGCAFLRAGLEELQALGHSEAARLVVGVDVDREGTAPQVRELLQRGVPRENLVYGDFLASPALPMQKFQAVVGNPPYIRHHWHSASWQEDARRAMEAAGAAIPNRASSWAYFVVQSCRFIRSGGRLAFVLPGAVLQADYATGVLDFLRDRFEKVRLIRLGERLFDADEQSVLLLGEGRMTSGEGTLLYNEVDRVADVSSALQSAAVAPLRAAAHRFKHAALPQAAAELLDAVLDDDRCAHLSSVAAVRLGVVTGANSFFVRALSDAPSGPGIRRRRAVSRSGWLRSARWVSRDMDAVEAEGLPTRMIYIAPSGVPDAELAQELAAAEQDGLPKRSHLSRREPWYSLTDSVTPDAMLPYMASAARGVALNEARSICTNAVHRLIFDSRLNDAERAAVVISSWSSVFAFAAELHGRHYGGGVLKLELADAQRLPILCKGVEPAHLHRLDDILRLNGVEAGRDYADQVFARDVLDLADSEVRLLHSSVAALQDRRISTKHKRQAR